MGEIRVGVPFGDESEVAQNARKNEKDARIERLIRTAVHGLSAAYSPYDQAFAHTVRIVKTDRGVVARTEGANLRYSAMAGLGLARTSEADQDTVLSGGRATDLVATTAARAETSPDPGAVALAAWALAEVNGIYPERLLARLARCLRSGQPLATVDLAWMVTAMTAVQLEDTRDVFDEAVSRLQEGQGAQGIFPHSLPVRLEAPWRAHVGSFADQVYPVQALARGHTLTHNQELLAAADRAANRLCELQGPAGQWWWHYDTRTGGVVERYPVYAVHQHAMAPMVLGDLARAGGQDHKRAVMAGLQWLHSPPETSEELISERFGLIWRKVGRREPPKAARAVKAASTWLAPDRELPGLDRLLPPGPVDHECRPYELGWLLYAWLPGGDKP